MKKVALLLAGALMLTGCTTPENTVVRLAAHDSFVISDELVAQFESDTGYELRIQRLGDTGSLTNQLVLTKNAPVADAFFGIDNTFFGRAETEGIFGSTPAAIDYSDVCFNYDIAWFDDADLTPPATWRALVDEEYRGLTVLTNPNFSSPGLAFLATTHAAFDSTAEVQEFWEGLRDNDVRVAGSWEDAYFTDFTRYGGNFPIVLSYASSPSAEVNEDGSPGSKALLEECFRQTEFAGVIADSDNIAGAQALVEFMLGDDFQRSVPEAMYVYPAVEGTEVPAAWAEFATPALSTLGEGLDINANREKWLSEWSEVFAG
ncbi:MAG: thiamine ABC transporter substrate-binding protein [Pontimonas sp.]